MNFYVIRRMDSLEYFRPAKGPTWKRRPAWTSDIERAKIYGTIGIARSARTTIIADITCPNKITPIIKLQEIKTVIGDYVEDSP